MVSFFSQQRSVFFLALVALTVLVAVPPGGLHVAAQTDDSIVESTMEPTMGATDPIVAPPEDDDEPRDSALDCSPELLGDGQCDDEFNTEACGELSFCLFLWFAVRCCLTTPFVLGSCGAPCAAAVVDVGRDLHQGVFLSASSVGRGGVTTRHGLSSRGLVDRRPSRHAASGSYHILYDKARHYDAVRSI